jgi:hypothetical protein
LASALSRILFLPGVWRFVVFDYKYPGSAGEFYCKAEACYEPGPEIALYITAFNNREFIPGKCGQFRVPIPYEKNKTCMGGSPE